MAVAINGVSVDIAAGIVRDERGRTLSLRPQCFAVLRILLENPERIVSKRELMHDVWPDVAVTDDSLVQCVHEIRKVLGDHDHSIISTAQRQGYRFQNPTITRDLANGRLQLTPARLAAASLLLLISVSAGLWFAAQSSNTRAEHADRTETAADTIAQVSKAREEYLLGLYYFHKPNPDNLAIAKAHFEDAIALDPDLSAAHAALAKTYAQVSTLAYSRALGINFDDADLKARQALEGLKGENADAHTVRSWLALKKFQNREAIAEAEMALELSPNDTDAMEALARASIFGAQPRRGIELANAIMRQNPTIADRSLFLKGLAEFAMENYPEAARYIEHGMELGSQDIVYAGVLASAYGLLGNAEKSREAYRIFMTGFGERPDLARQMIIYPFSDPRTAQSLAAGLQAAGAKVWFSRDDGGYLRLDRSNRLAGREIAPLLKNSQIEGGGFWCGESWQRGESEFGLVEYDGKPIHQDMPSNAVGISSVEGDLLCEKWPTDTKNLKFCSPVFRIPEGNARKRWGTYVMVTDTGPHPFKLAGRTAQAGSGPNSAQ